MMWRCASAGSEGHGGTGLEWERLPVVERSLERQDANRCTSTLNVTGDSEGRTCDAWEAMLQGRPSTKLVARRTGADGLFILPGGHAVHDTGCHAKAKEAETASTKPAERQGAERPPD